MFAMKPKELKMFGGISVPRYCVHCGRKLKQGKLLLGFSEKTGERLIGTLVYCPAWLGTMVMSHLTYNFDEKGNEIIERY